MKYTTTLPLSLLLAIAAVLTTGIAYAEAPAGQPSLGNGAGEMGKSHQAQSRPTVAQQELDTFFSSEYTYWDAAVLASFWGQDLEEAKARIGRKIGWGPVDIAILEQFLLDARIESLQTVSALQFYGESSYTYDDAAVLAEFWGDATPYDAKLRIELNLIMGNADEVATALQLATP